MMYQICYFRFDRTTLNSGPHYESVSAGGADDARGKFLQRHPQPGYHIADVISQEDPDNPETRGDQQ